MLQQVYIDSRYADVSYQTCYQSFWVSDPLTKPEGFYFKVHVLSAWIPMTYYNVFLENNRLHIEYNSGDSQRIVFPEGNRDVDFLVSFLNLNLKYGYEAVYDPSTNKISFSRTNTQNEHLVFCLLQHANIY
jgi:hypothetical protein